jgi:hypothetical protein
MYHIISLIVTVTEKFKSFISIRLPTKHNISIEQIKSSDEIHQGSLACEYRTIDCRYEQFVASQEEKASTLSLRR